MIKLENVSIKRRLMFILLIWIVTFVGFGAFVIKQMSNLADETKFMYEHPLQVSSSAIEARVNIIKMQRIIRDCALVNSEADRQREILYIEYLDKEILENLDIIKNQADTQKSIKIAERAIESYLSWKSGREQNIRLIQNGKPQEAIASLNGKYKPIVEDFENMLVQLADNSRTKADERINKLKILETNQRWLLIGTIILLSTIFFIIFDIIIKSILIPIQDLKEAMNKSIDTGELVLVNADGKNEIAKMAAFYNDLTTKLISMFWIKDNKDILNQKLSEYYTVEKLAQNTINTLCRTVSGGRGVFYVYEKENNLLSLEGSYAFHETDKLAVKLQLGEGIVGQVALEKCAILLKNIKSENNVIYTSIISQMPVNSYVFPIIYEEEMCGVIEIASTEAFEEAELEYLDEASHAIAISLYSAMQSAKIVELLKLSEEAREEVNYKAAELKKANTILHNQQDVLQQQAAELQQTNAELEEQQQQLQQQSEELQQTNLQLEEQQQQLQQQTMLLNGQNAKLEEVKGDLELSNKYKSDFLANMSHELRTPLNSIILLSKLLLNSKKELLSDPSKEKINVIHNSGQELLRLINDILDLSKIEAGRVSIDNTFFYSSVLVEEIRNMFEGAAKEKKLELKIEDKVAGKLYGDRYKIAQILRNFISNAVKFTEKGSVKVKIKQDADLLKGVIFSVRDSGIGIPKEQQKAIFEEFKQGDGSISRKYGGTGLGLSISKKLAEIMGGDIKLLSQIGEGSEFILYIPEMIITGERTEVILESAENEAAATEIDLVEAEMIGNLDESNKLILVIEDDITFSQYVRQVIQGMGFEAIIAKNGRSGLELAKEYRPKGILLDLGLPDIHGMDVLRELKSIKELRNIPVHILSVYDRSNKPQKIGAIGYHQKPIEEGEIMKVISQMVAFAEKLPKTVLLIEDNKVQQEYIETLLEDKDVQVTIVDTELAAKEKINNDNNDIIILDLELAEGNGLNICKFAGEKKIDTPIIVYTSKELTLEQEKEIRKYVDSIILKTAYSEERLLDEVTLFLHKVRKGNEPKEDKCINLKENHEISLNGKGILVVDDDPRNVYAVAAVLEDYKANIIEAYNGKIAIQKLNEEKVDLILMDIMMPEMDGYEAIRRIKKDNKFKHIPIIALTAKSLKGDKYKCIEAGANDYISKPMDYDNLIKVIKAWISKK